MQIIKRLFDFYINSSIHVGLAVVALSWITLLEFHVSLDVNLLCFIGFASITGYNFVKYYGLAKFHHRSLADWLKVIQLFSLICFVLLCYFALQLPVETLMYIAIFGIITFLYAIPLLPKRLFMDQKKKLRSISGLKIYIIALVWAGVTVILPLLNNAVEFQMDIFITAIQRFLIVIVLMLPFEIRDLKYDSLKLSTIPQKIGVKQTKLLGIILLVLLLLMEFLKDSINESHLVSLMMISVVIIGFLLFSSKERGRYYSSFWVEAIPVFWLLLIKIM